MKVKLYLHGHLRDKIQKDFVEVEANTLLDALRNLEAKYRKELKAPLDIGRWKIKVKDFETRESWNVPLFVDEVHIYPIFRMGKNSNWVQVGIGTALMVVGAAMMYFGAPTGWVSSVGAFTFKFGLALVIGGVISMFLTPTNETNDSGSNSKYLGAGSNTTAAGTRIPFGYGKFKIAGQVLSYNVSSSNLKVYKGT